MSSVYPRHPSPISSNLLLDHTILFCSYKAAVILRQQQFKEGGDMSRLRIAVIVLAIGFIAYESLNDADRDESGNIVSGGEINCAIWVSIVCIKVIWCNP